MREPVITNTGMTVSNVQDAAIIRRLATDDTDDADVVFTVSNIPTGGDRITSNNVPNNDGVLKFTLAQVKAGVVFYDDSNTVGTEGFTFTVRTLLKRLYQCSTRPILILTIDEFQSSRRYDG